MDICVHRYSKDTLMPSVVEPTSYPIKHLSHSKTANHITISDSESELLFDQNLCTQLFSVLLILYTLLFNLEIQTVVSGNRSFFSLC